MFYGFSKEEILDIQWNLNNWIWDERMGEKPKGYDEMSDRQKYKILTPILNEMRKEITEYERIKYNIVNKLGKSKWYFFKFWLKHQLYYKWSLGGK